MSNALGSALTQVPSAPGGCASAPGPRVLQVVSGTALAGTERHVLGLAEQLRLLGCDVQIACPHGGELTAATRAAGIPVRSLASLGRVPAPDVVHVHDGRSALIGLGLAATAGVALVRTQHFVLPASAVRRGPSGPASVGLHRLINRRLDGYICVSEAAAQAARARREVTHAVSQVIPPGVALPSDAELEAAVAARGAAHHPIVLSAGRLEPERRFDVLLEAVPKVLEAVPDCEFVIAGTGSAERTLESQVRDLGVEKSVTWAGWLRGMSSAMARAHIYVNTLAWEGFGMATAEAMGYALPVVAARGGANSDLVRDGVTGRLVEPADASALAAAVTALLADPGAAAAMGAAGRVRAADHYSLRASAEATLAFYLRLLHNRQGRRRR